MATAPVDYSWLSRLPTKAEVAAVRGGGAGRRVRGAGGPTPVDHNRVTWEHECMPVEVAVYVERASGRKAPRCPVHTR